MLGFLRKVQTSLFLYHDLWNKSRNEITPLIDYTIRIATKMPFSNANNYYSPVRLFHNPTRRTRSFPPFWKQLQPMKKRNDAVNLNYDFL